MEFITGSKLEPYIDWAFWALGLGPRFVQAARAGLVAGNKVISSLRVNDIVLTVWVIIDFAYDQDHCNIFV